MKDCKYYLVILICLFYNSKKKENLSDNLSDKLSDELSDQKMVGLSPEGLDLGRAFEKKLEGLENLVKLFKSDVSKMFDISDYNVK